MTVKVISVDHDGTQGTVTCESDITDHWPNAIEELKNGATRNTAIAAVAKEGLPDPRCGMTLAPYAIDDKGETVVRPKEQQIAAYRVDVAVTRRIV